MALAIADRTRSWDVPVEVSVLSAGVKAIPGSQRCGISLAYVGHAADASTGSRRLDADLLVDVDVVLVAQDSHISAVRELDAGALVVPLRRAGRNCERAAESELTAGVSDASLRRFFAATAASDQFASGSSRVPYGPDDIPDPHVLGMNLHQLSAEYIQESIALVFAQVARFAQ